jgi:hypothetical protein
LRFVLKGLRARFLLRPGMVSVIGVTLKSE